MRLVTPKINVEVKYKKVSVNQLVPKPEIIMRSPDGKLVESKRAVGENIIDSFHWVNLTEDGRRISSRDIRYFQVLEDGSERYVRPFDRTKEIKVVKEVSASSMNGFLEESHYELFHVDTEIQRQLYEEAERYLKEDLVGIALFSWGRGFKQFYALVYPVLKDGKFVWVMKLTQTRIEYQHLMEIPAKAVPVPEPPTLDALPPVEAIVG